MTPYERKQQAYREWLNAINAARGFPGHVWSDPPELPLRKAWPVCSSEDAPRCAVCAVA